MTLLLAPTRSACPCCEGTVIAGKNKGHAVCASLHGYVLDGNRSSNALAVMDRATTESCCRCGGVGCCLSTSSFGRAKVNAWKARTWRTGAKVAVAAASLAGLFLFTSLMNRGPWQAPPVNEPSISELAYMVNVSKLSPGDGRAFAEVYPQYADLFDGTKEFIVEDYMEVLGG